MNSGELPGTGCALPHVDLAVNLPQHVQEALRIPVPLRLRDHVVLVRHAAGDGVGGVARDCARPEHRADVEVRAGDVDRGAVRVEAQQAAEVAGQQVGMEDVEEGVPSGCSARVDSWLKKKNSFLLRRARYARHRHPAADVAADLLVVERHLRAVRASRAARHPICRLA